MATGRIEKRYKDSWTIIIELGYDSDGKRQRTVESIKVDTEKEAQDYLDDRLYELRHGSYIKPNNITVSEYLDKWLEIKKSRLAPKTYHSYKSEIDRHIKPKIGKIRLQLLDAMTLQEYYSSMETSGRIIAEPKKGKGGKKKEVERKKDVPPGLSQRTVNYHHKIMSAALKQAVKWKYISTNPAAYVDVPTFEKKEMQVLYKGELEKFLKLIESHMDYRVIFVAVMTGMRQGEVLGLRWQDIDLDYGMINVRQQLQYVPKQGWFFKKPKSKKSTRSIPMQLPLNKLFRDIKKEQTECRLQEEEKLLQSKNSQQTDELDENDYKTVYDDKDLILCQPNGKNWDANKVTNRFKDLVIAFGRPELRFHDLRHTFAALALAAGITMDKLQRIMGHESITTTIDMYGHFSPETLSAEMKKLSQYLGFEALAK